MSPNTSQSPNPDNDPHYFKDLSFRLFKKVNLKVATLGAFIVFVVTTAVTIEGKRYGTEINSIKESLGSEIKSVTEKYNRTKTEAEKLKREEIKLRSENDQLQRNVDALNQANRIPTLIFPVDNRPIIGKYVRFKWSYGVSSGFKNFVLELRRNVPSGVIVARYPIPEGHKRREIPFQFPESISGQFYWRIGTGELLHEYQGYSVLADNKNGEQGLANSDKVWASLQGRDRLDFSSSANAQVDPQSETRLWSRFGSFSIYKSVWEKLKRTQNFVVGTTAAYLSYDYPVDCRGRPESYDMDLIEEIARRLEKKLRAEVDVEQDVRFWLKARKIDGDYIEKEKEKFLLDKDKYMKSFRLNVVTKIIDWSDKFTSVIGGDVDVTIANLTKSDTREENNPGLKFSKGYRENKQTIIISKLHSSIDPKQKGAELIAALKGKTLAVQDTSTNMKAAKYLNGEMKLSNGKYIDENKQIGFEIDKKPYDSYVDVIDQVRSSKTDLGMIDSVRFNSVYYPDLIKLDLDDELEASLREFNELEFGQPTEQYAIAFASYGGRNLFEYYLNQAIDDTKAWRDEELEGKHSINSRQARTRKSLGCERLQRVPWVGY